MQGCIRPCTVLLLSSQHPCFAGQDKPVTDAALEFAMRPVNYGLNSALALTCGFTKGLADGPVPSGSNTAWRFAIAVWSNLPVDLPATAIEVWVFTIVCPLWCQFLIPLCTHPRILCIYRVLHNLLVFSIFCLI